MILLEDLGMQYVSENSAKRTRLGKYECSRCHEPFVSNTYNVRHKKIEHCRSCATSLGNKSRKGMKYASK